MENELMVEMAMTMSNIRSVEVEIGDLQKEIEIKEEKRSEYRKKLESLALAYYSEGQTGAVEDKKLKLYDKVRLIRAEHEAQRDNVGRVATVVSIDEDWSYPYGLHFEEETQKSDYVYERNQLEKLEVR